MPATAELSKEEQELFNAMSNDKPEKPAPKEEPKAEVKAEEKADPKGEEKQEKPEAKMIPKAALDEARIENKDLKAQLKDMQTLVAEGDKKLNKFIESVRAKTEEKPAPKFEDDPAGALKAENEELKKGLAEVNKRLAEQAQASEQGSKLHQHAATVQAKETAFAKEQPAYWKAAEYVAEVWRDEFLEAGYEEEKVAAMVFQKGLATTGQALHKGKNPAETIWKLAARFGFKAEAPKGEEKKAEAKAEGETKLETIRKGQEAAKAAGGAKGLPDDLTLASLAQMDDEAIDKLVADSDWWAKNVRRSPLH